MIDDKFDIPEVREIQKKYGISEEDLDVLIGNVVDVIAEMDDVFDDGMSDEDFAEFYNSL